MPDDALFCPNCGRPVEEKTSASLSLKEITVRYIIIGLIGGFLSITISSLLNTNLYFIPAFLSSILIIYMYRIRDFKDSLLAAFSIYLFYDGILGGFILGYSFISNVPYEMVWLPKLWEVILYASSPISAFVAAYIGVKITPEKKKAPVVLPPKGGKPQGGVIYSYDQLSSEVKI